MIMDKKSQEKFASIGRPETASEKDNNNIFGSLFLKDGTKRNAKTSKLEPTETNMEHG